jgi:lipopolysaccharide transport system ATP-binding protein
MPDIEQYCERAILLDRGTPQFIGSASEATKHYYLLHQTGHSKIPPRARSHANESRKTPENHSIALPPAEAFIDLSSKPQVSSGRARCTGIALCSASGEPCNTFRQGDSAVFYYEFELSDTIGVPICGVLITNDRGVIVHGKNSWQFEDEFPASFEEAKKVICRQEVSLCLGPGEYSFEIGLASVPESDWINRKYISHEEWASRYSTECVVTNAGHLSIGYACKDNVLVLTHHGVADLPGKILIEMTK